MVMISIRQGSACTIEYPIDMSAYDAARLSVAPMLNWTGVMGFNIFYRVLKAFAISKGAFGDQTEVYVT